MKKSSLSYTQYNCVAFILKNGAFRVRTNMNSYGWCQQLALQLSAHAKRGKIDTEYRIFSKTWTVADWHTSGRAFQYYCLIFTLPSKRRAFHTGMLRRFLFSLDLPACEQTVSALKFNKSRYNSSVTDDHLPAVTADVQPDSSALVQARDTPGPAEIWYHLTHNILLSNPQLLHISTDYKNSAVIPLARHHSVPNSKPLPAHVRTTRSRISIFGRKLRFFLTWAKDHANSLIVQPSQSLWLFGLSLNVPAASSFSEHTIHPASMSDAASLPQLCFVSKAVGAQTRMMRDLKVAAVSSNQAEFGLRASIVFHFRKKSHQLLTLEIHHAYAFSALNVCYFVVPLCRFADTPLPCCYSRKFKCQ